ncbi:hypothetical protein A2V71_03830 [Candidatus Berkelbacteria bacterium RBG_13_40_8]|uniref:Uncharacterized protein n=1 Tax=Candidatus Berkelbacteria bacterium RBG_13_40_8 TaxID=1797467 RepID=A0A1F5DLN8_9BACT|nr:MAG: hypothetical protein A2V71_03830 [Candidatus Berkelbacteria bacterium RBG_13_40_8]
MKENFFKVITIILVIIFCGGAYFTIRFLKKEMTTAVEPAKDVMQKNSSQFDNATYQAVMERLSQ